MPENDVAENTTNIVANELIKEIGHYDKRNPSIDFSALKADNALYKNSIEYSKKYQKLVKKQQPNNKEAQIIIENQQYFRQKFLKHLEARMDKVPNYDYKKNADIIKNNPEKATISMVDLLDSTGVKLYKMALKEEMNSKEYMNALLDHSTEMEKFKDASWAKRPIVFVGGPSGGGKSFAATSVINAASKYIGKTKDGNGINKVISVDGGITREVSQMRKLLVKLANNKGYTAISDLHDKSGALEKAKKRLFEYAINQPDAGMVIPETFSKFKLPGNYAKKMLERVLKEKNSQMIFTRVVGMDPDKFKEVVAIMGKSRAMKTKDFDTPSKLDLNSKPDCESKKYGASGFKYGVTGSESAEAYVAKLEENLINMIVVNDLIAVQKIGDNNWTEKINYSHNGAIEKISARMFKAWRGLGENRPSLEEYTKDIKNQVPPIIKSSVEVRMEVALNSIDDKIERNKELEQPNVELINLRNALQAIYQEGFSRPEKIQGLKDRIDEYVDVHKSYKTTKELLQFASKVLAERLVELKEPNVNNNNIKRTRSQRGRFMTFIKEYKNSKEKKDSDPISPKEVTIVSQPKDIRLKLVEYTDATQINKIKDSLKTWQVSESQDRAGKAYMVSKDKMAFTVHKNSFKTVNHHEETFIAMLNAYKAVHADGTLPTITISNEILKDDWLKAMDKVFPESTAFIHENINDIIITKGKSSENANQNQPQAETLKRSTS